MREALPIVDQQNPVSGARTDITPDVRMVDEFDRFGAQAGQHPIHLLVSHGPMRCDVEDDPVAHERRIVAARFVVLLEQDDLLASLCQMGGRGQARNSPSDDDCVITRRVSHNSMCLSEENSCHLQIPSKVVVKPQLGNVHKTNQKAIIQPV